jgi:CubicO group peptidase (beta-lactamase class C family)
VIQRVAALPLADFLREEILLKCEMPDARMAFTPEVQGEYAGRIGIMYSLKDGEFVPSASNLPAALQNPSPGSSFRGPARQLGHFYEMLLRHGATRWGVQILREQTVQAMTSRQRSGLRDETFQHVIDFGLGVILNSQRSAAEPVPYGYGPLASPETFGHGGAQSSVGFADPQHALVVIIITNATPGDAPHQQRMQDLTRGLYEDLGLC